jgi:hypothetical protein
MKNFFFVLPLWAVLATPAVAAEEEPKAQSFVVTSLSKCLDQLDPADAAEIRKSFVKPYQECQARLAEKLAQEKQKKAGDAEDAAVPETPRNYVRVQRPRPAAPAEEPSENKAK